MDKASGFWKWSGLFLAGAALVVFIFMTPPSLLRKLDYIGAAVCHRQASHSFFIGGHQLPVCQRCTGTFSGALTGLLFQLVVLRRRRARRFPPLWVWGTAGFFFALWALDGVNSFAIEQFGRSLLGYETGPATRLFSGIFMGMSMSVVLVPAFNQTLWADGLDEYSLRTWKELLVLVLVEFVQAVLIYQLIPWTLYPVALYTGLGIVTMFILLGTMIWVMALGRDQVYPSWRQAWLPLLWGVVFAALIVGGMDGLRLFLTGTIDTLPGLSMAL